MCIILFLCPGMDILVSLAPKEMFSILLLWAHFESIFPEVESLDLKVILHYVAWKTLMLFSKPLHHFHFNDRPQVFVFSISLQYINFLFSSFFIFIKDSFLILLCVYNCYPVHMKYHIGNVVSWVFLTLMIVSIFPGLYFLMSTCSEKKKKAIHILTSSLLSLLLNSSYWTTNPLRMF